MPKNRLLNGLPDLRTRSKNLIDLAASGEFYCIPQPLNDKAKQVLNDDGLSKLRESRDILEKIDDWKYDNLKQGISAIAGEKLGPYMHPLRAALTGRTSAPGVFEIMVVLGKRESLARISGVLS